MTNSRAKGKAGELELAAYLRDHGIEARRGQQFSGGTDSPDVVTSLNRVHFECKRTERTDLYGWMAQAISDAGDKLPVVVHRKSREDWLAIMPLHELLKLLENSGHGYKPSVGDGQEVRSEREGTGADAPVRSEREGAK